MRPKRTRLAVERQVLGDGQVGRDIDFLGEERDARGFRLGDRARRERPCRPSRCSPDQVPAGWTPDSTWISVDLPAPFWPSSATISPGAIVRSTLSTATTPGKILVSAQHQQRLRNCEIAFVDCMLASAVVEATSGDTR